MPKYTYKVKTRDGKTLTGEIDSSSKDMAIAKLKEKGYFIVGPLKEKSKEMTFFKKKVKTSEVSIFARQFATMIGSGVNLVRCLNIMEDQVENPAFREIVIQVRNDVESGSTFSSALGRHPLVFSVLFCDLVRAGEAGGILDQILERLANYLESSEQLKAKVKGALTYPAVVFSVAILVVIFLITFVLPNFQQIFEGMGDATLPLPTRILLGLSSFFQKYFIIIIIGIGFGIWGVKKFFDTKQGRRLLDTYSLVLPGIGNLLRKVAVSKFTRTLGTLISAGVPILQALEVTANTAGNVIITEAVLKTRVSIKEGESISEPLKQSAVFPPMVIQMIAVGEETGELDVMLSKVADFYDQEVDTAVKGLTSIIEPIVIVFMGVVIGGIVLAIFMPMLEMINQAG
ncbi:MAG: type II secretion system F family protein [Candidatus Muirbacterium halophilum]|nr:type II secretion system F family protein [Candidatus Muirbacterium halophilum]MCK9475686.1 type II secretion system F family protein [Candidatus Muirbacterium halophilum]